MRIPITAREVRTITGLYFVPEIAQKAFFHKRKPANSAAVKALGKGIIHSSGWRMAVLCCEVLAESDQQHVAEALEFLVIGVTNTEGYARSAAAAAMRRLAEQNPGAATAQWQLLRRKMDSERTNDEWVGGFISLAMLSHTDEMTDEVLRLPKPDSWTKERAMLAVMRGKPDSMALILGQQLLEGGSFSSWDWTVTLGETEPSRLESVGHLFSDLDDTHKLRLLHLLAEAPLKPLLQGLRHCLISDSEELVFLALERLQKFQLAVPSLVESLVGLRAKWGDSTVSRLSDEIVGQSGGRPGAGSLPKPQGKSPTLQVEIKLEPTCGSLSLEQSLRRSEVHFTGRQLVFKTPLGLHCFDLVQGKAGPERVAPFPGAAGKNDSRPSVSFIGQDGDLILVDFGAYDDRYYLLRNSKLRKLDPPLPRDHAPTQEDLRFDGNAYGWSKEALMMGPFESDPGHYEDVAYTLNARSGRLEARFAANRSWSKVEYTHLTAGLGRVFKTEPDLIFRYTAQGGYRQPDKTDLVIPTPVNPCASAAAANREAILLLDAFADGVLRASLWLGGPYPSSGGAAR